MTKKEIIEKMMSEGVECNYCDYDGSCEGYPLCYEMECDYDMWDIDRYLKDCAEKEF